MNDRSRIFRLFSTLSVLEDESRDKVAPNEQCQIYTSLLKEFALIRVDIETCQVSILHMFLFMNWQVYREALQTSSGQSTEFDLDTLLKSHMSSQSLDQANATRVLRKALQRDQMNSFCFHIQFCIRTTIYLWLVKSYIIYIFLSIFLYIYIYVCINEKRSNHLLANFKIMLG